VKSAVPITTLLLLAACSGGDDGRSNTQEAAIANRITLDASGKPQPVSATSRRDHAAPDFPSAMLGRWGITEADCDPSNNDNKGLMVVNADSVRFYDTQAKLVGAERRSEYTVAADLGFKRDGRKWTARQSFALAGGGTALLRGEQSPVKTYRYGRC
jgi:hypothetical protein